MITNKLIEAYPDWINSGIFSDLQSFDVPWKDAQISGALDAAYYGSHSGDKIISPFLEKFLPNAENTPELSGQARTSIAKAIYTMCGNNWAKLYATLNLTYDPIANVDANISESIERTGKRDSTDNIKNTGTLTRAYTGTDTTTNTGTNTNAVTGTDTTTNTGTNTNAVTGYDTVSDSGTVKTDGTTNTTRTNNTDLYGFNSAGAVPSDAQTGNEDTAASSTETRDLTNKTQYDTTETETLNTQSKLERGTTETEALNTQSKLERGTTETETRDLSDDHTGSENTSGTETHTVTRKGNIGVTTTQSMIEEERDVWRWYFYEYVFQDLDKFLTIGVY